METLKPCPFCGGEASKRLFYKGKYRIHCNVCDAHSGDVCDTEAEAIAAWNTRKWKTCRLELEEPKEDGVWWCSYCKSYHQHKSKYPWAYCPRCGAKVVG